MSAGCGGFDQWHAQDVGIGGGDTFPKFQFPSIPKWGQCVGVARPASGLPRSLSRVGPGPTLGPLVGAQGMEPPEAPGFYRFKSPKNQLQGVYFTYNFWISVLLILVVWWSCYLTWSSVPPIPPKLIWKMKNGGRCSPWKKHTHTYPPPHIYPHKTNSGLPALNLHFICLSVCYPNWCFCITNSVWGAMLTLLGQKVNFLLQNRLKSGLGPQGPKNCQWVITFKRKFRNVIFVFVICQSIFIW